MKDTSLFADGDFWMVWRQHMLDRIEALEQLYALETWLNFVSCWQLGPHLNFQFVTSTEFASIHLMNIR
jgi:hypothetical protein